MRIWLCQIPCTHSLRIRDKCNNCVVCLVAWFIVNVFSVFRYLNCLEVDKYVLKDCLESDHSIWEKELLRNFWWSVPASICTFSIRNFDFRCCQDCLSTARPETFFLVSMFWTWNWCTTYVFSLKIWSLIAIFKQTFQRFLVVGSPQARDEISPLCFERSTSNCSIWQAKVVLFGQIFKEKAYLVHHFHGPNMFTKKMSQV